MNKISSGSSTTTVFWTRRLSLSILLFGCVCNPSWGQSQATESKVETVEIVGNPLVNNEKVKIRIKVKNPDKKPVTALEYENFKLFIDDKPVDFTQENWTSPKKTKPAPTWIIFLLDLSGSMQKPDKKGTTKLEGAIDAIREFTNTLEKRSGETKVAIVPFGEPGLRCSKGYPVTKKELDSFSLASDGKVSNSLDNLAKEEPCAATRIYEPLTEVINFLNNPEDKRFNVSEDSNQLQPRLAVVLLSDGYDSYSSDDTDDKERFQKLISRLEKQNAIVVHTLGYGLTPKELGQKYGLNKPATREDIYKGDGKLPSGKVPQDEFVDQERLKKIANVTGGIAEFSPDAETVAKRLKDFVDALLGEYEITYTQPNAERGSRHNVYVEVLSVRSNSKCYRMAVFGQSLPLPVRLWMLVIVFILLIIGGGIPFWLWGRALKREAQEALEG